MCPPALYCCVRLCLAILYTCLPALGCCGRLCLAILCLPALDVASSSFDVEKHKLFGVYGGVISSFGSWCFLSIFFHWFVHLYLISSLVSKTRTRGGQDWDNPENEESSTNHHLFFVDKSHEKRWKKQGNEEQMKNSREIIFSSFLVFMLSFIWVFICFFIFLSFALVCIVYVFIYFWLPFAIFMLLSVSNLTQNDEKNHA